MACDIELGGVSAALAVSNSLIVHKQVKGTVYPVEPQSDLRWSFPIWRDFEQSSVGSYGILSRNKRWIDRKRIWDVGIVRLAITLQLPMAWDLDGLPPVDIMERRRCELKVPSAVQQKRLLRDPVGPSRQTVTLDHKLVAIVGGL